MEDKTMKKVFGIAALLLTLAACNKIETEITPVEHPSDSKGITITATLAPKTADTKAVADGGDKITVTWAKNEHIAILYDKDGAQVADATITAVDRCHYFVHRSERHRRQHRLHIGLSVLRRQG